MLVGIGKPSVHDGDLVALLVACHERIRRFIALARAVASGEGRAEEGAVREACRAAARYFEEALPLHVRDEEDSIEPRLRGRDAGVDAALDAMHAQHARHEPLVSAFVAAAEALAARPDDAAAAGALADATAQLGRELDEHLALEERVLFPAIERLLAAGEREAIVRELRARRGA